MTSSNKSNPHSKGKDLASRSFFLPADIRDQLKAACEKTGAPAAEIVRRALRQYLATM